MISNLSPRKPDLLDELNAVRYRRRIAYEEGRNEDVLICNLEIKSLRLQNGWSESEAQEEFEENQRHFEKPFQKTNSLMSFDVIDCNGKPANTLLSINELSRYNFLRGIGIPYAESLVQCRKW